LDSLSQIALGAAVAYAVAGRRLGRKALVYGGLAGTLPDLDTLVLMPFDGWAGWRHHRGVSHSLFFAPVVAPVLGWLAWKRENRLRPFEPAGGHDALGAWIALFFFAIFTHPLLDFFTIYGTQLLAPFSDARFAVPGLGIIDPGYTLPLLAGLAVAGARPQARRARLAVYGALLVSTIYLFYGLSQNRAVERLARAQLDAEGVAAADVRVYTTIFQPWLRRVVVDDAQGARVGFASPFQPGAIAWTCFAHPSDPAIAAARATPEARLLDWFAMGETWPTVSRGADGSAVVRLTDRRYGAAGATVQGWWGIEVRLDPAGRPATPPERIDIPRGATGEAIGQLFAAARGKATPLFPHAADAASAAAACAANRIG
jgi:inner membrane protein